MKFKLDVEGLNMLLQEIEARELIWDEAKREREARRYEVAIYDDFDNFEDLHDFITAEPDGMSLYEQLRLEQLNNETEEEREARYDREYNYSKEDSLLVLQYKFMNKLKERSNEYTPVKTGRLSRSIRSVFDISSIDKKQGSGISTVYYDTNEAPYAVYVHEIEGLHEVGQAKFLETAFVEEVGELVEETGHGIAYNFTIDANDDSGMGLAVSFRIV